MVLWFQLLQALPSPVYELVTRPYFLVNMGKSTTNETSFKQRICLGQRVRFPTSVDLDNFYFIFSLKYLYSE